jgi:hypothetical protein
MKDSELLTLIAKKWLGTIIRALLVGVGSWLKATGKFPFLDSDVIAKAAAYAPDLAGDIMIAAGAAWSGFEKWHATRKLGTALSLPAGTSVAEFEKHV